MNFNIIEKSEIHCRMVPIIFFYALSLKYTFFYKGLAKSFSFLSKLKKEDFFGPLRIYVLYPVFYIFDDDETSFFFVVLVFNRGDTVSRRSPIEGVRPSPYTTLCS